MRQKNIVIDNITIAIKSCERLDDSVSVELFSDAHVNTLDRCLLFIAGLIQQLHAMKFVPCMKQGLDASSVDFYEVHVSNDAVNSLFASEFTA